MESQGWPGASARTRALGEHPCSQPERTIPLGAGIQGPGRRVLGPPGEHGGVGPRPRGERTPEGWQSARDRHPHGRGPLGYARGIAPQAIGRGGRVPPESVIASRRRHRARRAAPRGPGRPSASTQIVPVVQAHEQIQVAEREALLGTQFLEQDPRGGDLRRRRALRRGSSQRDPVDRPWRKATLRAYPIRAKRFSMYWIATPQYAGSSSAAVLVIHRSLRPSTVERFAAPETLESSQVTLSQICFRLATSRFAFRFRTVRSSPSKIGSSEPISPLGL